MTSTTLNPPHADDAGAGTALQLRLAREQEHLESLARQGGAWRARFRQRRELQRLRRALKWYETRAMGRDAFILKRGIITEALVAASWTALGFVLHPRTRDRDWMIDLLVFSLVIGGMAGLFGSVRLWDHEEANLQRWLTAETEAKAVKAS
ncbi:MAG TPA: hypothetical protein VFL97_09210 [Nitrococcus sp.]|nr:hypothetical protein [Nitrococcus sp.]